MRESRRIRVSLLGMAGLYWVVAVIVVIGHATARSIAIFAVVGVLFTAFDCLAARLVKKNSASLASPPPPEHNDIAL